jgi:hypothetical protein
MNLGPRTAIYHRKKGSKGRFNATFNMDKFWRRYYRENKKAVVYNKAKPLLQDLTHMMLTSLYTSDFIYFPHLGFFGIATTSIKRDTVDRNTKRVDWKKTQLLWKEQYPDSSPEELKLIKNKQTICYNNKMKNESLRLHWKKPYGKLDDFIFEPVTHFRKQLGRLAYDPGTKLMMEKVHWEEMIKQLKKNT